MTDDNFDPKPLADRLDAVLPPDQFEAPARDDDPLIDTALLLAAVPQPAPMSSDARLRIRAQVLASALPPQPRRITRFPVSALVRWGVAAALALVLFAGGIPPAVLASVAGDVLYPVKQTVERVETALATSPQSQAFVYLTHAQRRAEEALALLERGQLPADEMTAALDDLVAAKDTISEVTNLSESTRFQIEAQTVQVDSLLDAALTLAARLENVPPETITALTDQIRATQAGGGLLLPATPTPTETPEATAEPDVETLETAPVTEEPEVTAEATNLPANIVIAGPVEAINGNIITVFDIDVQVDPDDPILAEIQVGDEVRIEGDSEEVDGAFVIVAVQITVFKAETVVPNVPAGPPAPQGSPDCNGSKPCKQSKKN